MTAVKQITIIVPVYGDWPSLKDCIDSLILHTDPTHHKVMLVNDCGPEVELMEKNIQASIKGYNHFHYFRNKQNLGFLQNCNNAVTKLDNTNNDVLLLNSDTKVTAGFADEMQAVLYTAKQKIGAVSPRSNNATITTIPISAINQKGIGTEKSYRLYQKIKTKLPRYTIVPTAHGFCMLIRRELIKKYGLFDEVFGKGYGEEVDFCQRIRERGYECALANHAYVFHQEARSFSLETKAKLLEVNNKIIRERYPYYQQEVRDYIQYAQNHEPGQGTAAKLKQHVKRLLKR